MGIEVKILADSISPNNDRLTTFHLKYPRYIHSEIMTHRCFSKNSASSRAIPLTKMIEKVKTDPVIPIKWGKNQKGMQDAGEVDQITGMVCKGYWLEARDNAIKSVEKLMECGLHKSLPNRILEPWFHIEIILSGTDFGNFFNLRCHKDAEPSFQELARLMLIEYTSHIPSFLNYGEWHLPLTDKNISDEAKGNVELLKKISVARCARVSYLNFEGSNNIQKDIELHDKLKDAGHCSPYEHVATPGLIDKYYGNFKGWIQYRKMLPNENRKEFNPQTLLKALKGE